MAVLLPLQLQRQQQAKWDDDVDPREGYRILKRPGLQVGSGPSSAGGEVAFQASCRRGRLKKI